MSTAIVPLRPAPTSIMPSGNEWAMMKDMADIAVKSGMLPAHIKTPQAALFIAMKGRELGIPATYALSNIAVIGGKPVCGAELMLALIYRDHGDDAIIFEDTSALACTVSYKRRGWDKRRQFTFSMLDARTAGLTGGNWAKYPNAMLRARCVSAVGRMAFADTIAGMYTPEELGAAVSVTAEGEVVISEVQHEATQATAAAQTIEGTSRVVKDVVAGASEDTDIAAARIRYGDALRAAQADSRWTTPQPGRTAMSLFNKKVVDLNVAQLDQMTALFKDEADVKDGHVVYRAQDEAAALAERAEWVEVEAARAEDDGGYPATDEHPDPFQLDK